MREGKIDVRLREVFSGSSVHGRERVDRTRYDTIMDWLKGRIQDVQQRGWGRETLTDT